MRDKVKEDFPIDSEADQYVCRREFLKFMTLASGGLAVGSVSIAALSRLRRSPSHTAPVLICTTDELRKTGWREFTYPGPGNPCIVVQSKSGKVAAYSRRCTHLSCPVLWQANADRLYCPCHNGAFSAEDGSVLQGPPPRPLTRVILDIRDGEIWAVGIESAR
jgi:Rieske Fe-S protein